MKPSIKNLLLVALFAALYPLRAAEPAQTAKPNIVFIITDQQFAEAMSCRMGSKFISTPAVDQLAREGTMFTRAYSANPLCMPSRNSMFTGRFPHETGVTANEYIKGGLDTNEFVCLGTYFQRAGYQTAYFGKWHLCFDQKNPAAHGFETINTAMNDDKTAERAVEFINGKPTKPFLLVVSYLNPHNICEWARRLAGRTVKLSEGEIGEPPPLNELPLLPANFAISKDEPDSMALIRRAYQVDDGLFPVSHYTEKDWREQRWGYYRMMEKADAEIGKVLAALRLSGLEDNTVIIFTSDHGECAGAHHFNQKTVFYEESARVPLIIAYKGKTDDKTTDKLVNTGIDLLPTMLDFAGLEIPKKLPGRSLKSLVPGQSASAWRNHVVVENNMVQTGVVDGLRPEIAGRMVRSERYKYCVYSEGQRRESLVDLQADPGESVNLAVDPKYRDILLQHRALLAQFGKENNDPLVATLLADDVKPVPFTDKGPAPKTQKSETN